MEVRQLTSHRPRVSKAPDPSTDHYTRNNVEVLQELGVWLQVLMCYLESCLMPEGV